MAKINPQYKKMIEQIKIDGENFTDEEMKKVYKDQKSKLELLHTFVGLLFVKYAVDGFLKLKGNQKASVESEINNKLITIGKGLGQSEVNKVTDILKKVYSDTYYKNAFIIGSGLKGNLKFNLLKQEFIDAAVNQEFKGQLFSDRIWKNKAGMIDKLKKSILDCMQGETTVDKIGKDIQNIFNVQAYESKRLVTTEMARVQVDAQEAIAQSTGVKQVIWSATLDNKTAEYDASLDGQVWSINEEYPRPIYNTHPNCRCILINVPFADWQPTKRKDNESKDIIDYADYETWLKYKGINS